MYIAVCMIKKKLADLLFTNIILAYFSNVNKLSKFYCTIFIVEMELLTQPEHDAKYWTTVGNIPSSHAMCWNDTQRLDPLHRDIFEVMVIYDE